MVGCLLQICCGDTLTRQLAAKLINESVGYPKPVLDLISVGPSSLNFSGNKPDIFQASETAQLKKLRDAGLVQINNLKVEKADFQCCGSGVQYDASYFVQLTPQGRRYLISQDAKFAHVRLCSEELAEITGIAFSEDKTEARVEFNDRCADVTPFGRVEGVDENKLGARVANMQLYDDGWRVLEVLHTMR